MSARYIIGRNDDLAVHHRRAILDRVQAEDADLRRIDDRRAHQRAEHAAVGDAERAAAQIVERERAVVRALREVADAALDAGERRAVRVAQHRHDQAFGRAHGHADVVVVLEDDLVALDLGVEAREFLQRGDRGLHEERRDAEADAVLRLERFLLSLAQRHHRRHVHFIERRQQRGRLLRFDEAARDRRAALGHALARFGARRRYRRGDGAGHAWWRGAAGAGACVARSTSAFVTRGPDALHRRSGTSASRAALRADGVDGTLDALAQQALSEQRWPAQPRSSGLS